MSENSFKCSICGQDVGAVYYIIDSEYRCYDCSKKIAEEMRRKKKMDRGVDDMSKKRFIFATNEKWFLFDNETEDYMDMEDCKDKLNEQQATINLLLELLYLSEEIIIGEISSTIDEDIDKLDKLFKRKDIKEIERYVRGCDDE